MDLPPDKERAMRQFDADKKWDIVCDQVSWRSSGIAPGAW